MELDSRSPADAFVTTHWSIVLGAGSASSPGARQAWEELARVYWQPLYAHTRRRGHSHCDAQDLVQAFFERLIEKPVIQRAQRDRGRFRTFLLAALDNFLSNEHDRAVALKRGGGINLQPLHFSETEVGSSPEPASPEMPLDRLFDRDWAHAVLDKCLAQLAAEFAQDGKVASWEKLRPFLFRAPGPGEYEAASRQLGISSVLMRKAVSRLRMRLRTLARSEVARTVATIADLEPEFQHLIDVMARF